MPMKQPGKTVHYSANGKPVDMDMLRKKNELTAAVGNQRVNARGDEIGPGGKIVRKREDVMRDHYASQTGMPDESQPRKQATTMPIPTQPVAKANKKSSKSKVAEKAVETKSEEWVEDEGGNFERKE